jgi:prolyl-tRNA synthetase
MKLSNSFFYTIREEVKDEESKSGNLLVRSGMVKKSSNGIYIYMPLGLRVFKKIENVIRDEMNKAGALELLMPNLIQEDIYVQSKRRENFGSSMFSLKDRYDRSYVLGPTHEELFTEAAKSMVKSYKDLPFNLYQIGNKYRDEPRPRYGLIRVREFFMKDAYSFDKDTKGLDKSYQLMFDAYKNIFDRLKIDYKIVKADNGAMGGTLSEEFQAVTEIGEDTLVLCNNCDYASNLEVSTSKVKDVIKEDKKEKQLINTPNVKTIEEVSKFLNIDTDKLVKTLIYQADNKYYACIIKGNYDINETKLKKLLNVNELVLADPQSIKDNTNSLVGFAGPIDINIDVIIDQDVALMYNFVVGANKEDYHYINVNIDDFKYSLVGDIKNVKENDLCPKCAKPLYFKKGIEIGNTFKLGTKYSETLNLNYLDEKNELNPVVMGSYGIGLGRIMSSLAEQKSDDKGLVWPIEIAPFKVAIVLLDEEQKEYANDLYDLLNKENIDVILDDRDTRAGVKFNDMDLIGIPIRITIGKKASEGILEIKLREETNHLEISKNEVINKIKELVN